MVMRHVCAERVVQYVAPTWWVPALMWLLSGAIVQVHRNKKLVTQMHYTCVVAVPFE